MKNGKSEKVYKVFKVRKVNKLKINELKKKRIEKIEVRIKDFHDIYYMNLININFKGANKKQLIFNKPGQYLVHFENLSGELVFEIKTRGVDLKIFGLYHGKGRERYKITTVQYHTAPASKSSLLIKGVFDDYSSFDHQGLIRIEKEAQKSHAYEKNQNLVLSKNVFIDSKPQLEILANDVYCTHGSTTGYFNQEQIYYLQSRGLSKEKGEKILIDGFLSEVKKDIVYNIYKNYQQIEL